METVFEFQSAESVGTEKAVCLSVQPVLLECLEDYTTDKRGDVGSLCAFRFCSISVRSLIEC
jgi:hypothetical protein